MQTTYQPKPDTIAETVLDFVNSNDDWHRRRNIEIAEHLGCTDGAVAAALNRAGITRPTGTSHGPGIKRNMARVPDQNIINALKEHGRTKSTWAIADMLKVGQDRVTRWRDRLDIHHDQADDDLFAITKAKVRHFAKTLTIEQMSKRLNLTADKIQAALAAMPNVIVVWEPLPPDAPVWADAYVDMTRAEQTGLNDEDLT